MLSILIFFHRYMLFPFSFLGRSLLDNQIRPVTDSMKIQNPFHFLTYETKLTLKAN